MRALYLDSSAVVAWLFNEASSGVVIRAMNEAEIVVTSELTIVEAERAIHRAVAARLIKEASAHKLRALLARERSKWITISLTTDVLTRAGRAFPIEPLRTLDAMHLASALTLSEAFPDVAILALDRRIIANAAALGLATA